MARELVLIVDDEPPARKYVVANLKARGYEVLAAPSGPAALEIAATRPIDVVILDVMMPGMSGFDVLATLRRDSSVPVLMLSARGQEGDKVKALNLGADDYLTKPFGVNELLARVQAVLRRQPTESRRELTAYRHGELEIELASREVRLGGAVANLARKEYDLLACLAREAGKVLTHRQILQAVWGSEYGDETNYVWTYVRRVRLKIEPNPDAPRYLLTEPGVGYRLPASDAQPVGPAVRAERVRDGGALTARAAPPKRHTLPDRLSSFIGRERELAGLVDLLTTTRLVTLVGPGGVGKTRLALAVGATVDRSDAYEGGVWLVELAALSDPTLVPSAVAAALNVRESSDRPHVDALADVLGSQRCLLVLDNCEHLVGACSSFVDTLLKTCPQLSILATGRQPLDVAGQVVHRVSPLDVPRGSIPVPAELERFDAVRLFVERAKEVRAEFAIAEWNACAVVDLCRRLDGIPLAIELAAAWVRVLGPEQILDRIDDRFRLLVGGDPAASPRQQTLRATIEWSYDLLSDDERQLFGRLSVFAGGWTLPAVEAVCAPAERGAAHAHSADLTPDARRVGPTDDLFGLLTRLVDKSLVVAEVGAGGERFHMLETVREYARERAADAGETAILGRRHCDWFLALAERVPPERLEPAQVALLDRECDNVRAALRWSIEAGDVETGLRLGIALWQLWYARGQYQEGRAWLAELLALAGTAPPSALRTRALSWAGHLACCQGDLAAADLLVTEALSRARELGDDGEVAVAYQKMGHISRARGDLDGAATCYGDAQRINRRLGWQVWDAMTTNMLAMITLLQGDATRARALGFEALALFRQLDIPYGVAHALHLLGCLANSQGDYVAGSELLQEAVRLQRARDDRQGLSWSLLAMAQAALDEGDVRRAGPLLVEALDLAWEDGNRVGVAQTVEAIAGAMIAVRPDLTVRFVAAAASLRQTLGAAARPPERTRIEAWLDAAHRALGDAAYGTTWALGSLLGIDRAIVEARQAASGAGSFARDLPAGSYPTS